MPDDIFGIDARVTFEDVGNEIDNELELLGIEVVKLAALVRRHAWLGIGIHATRAVDNLDTDGASIQGIGAVPRAVPCMPGALRLVDETVNPEPFSRICRVAALGDHIVGADTRIPAQCQESHRFGKRLAGEMNDDVVNALTLVLRGNVDKAQGGARGYGTERKERRQCNRTRPRSECWHAVAARTH